MVKSTDELWAPSKLASYLGVPVATLYSWRYMGNGPRSIKVGRHLRYRAADVERWLDAQSG
jgi:excisionase family DNA binding protein